jgi:hypothetical protein
MMRYDQPIIHRRTLEKLRHRIATTRIADIEIWKILISQQFCDLLSLSHAEATWITHARKVKFSRYRPEQALGVLGG